MTQPLKVLDLFSGIGGFSLGLERTGGFETVAFCEIDKYCQKILAKHWPDVPVYSDVRLLDGSMFSNVDVITGGFPCQDISVAGRQAGMGKETRSGLWDDLCRLIGEIRPKYAIVENVSNLLSGPKQQRGGWFGKVLGDLAEIGFDAEWHCIPASAVGAPHIRDRVWIIAYPSSELSGSNPPRPSNRDAQASREGLFEINGETHPTFAGPLGEILAEPPGKRLEGSELQRQQHKLSTQSSDESCYVADPEKLHSDGGNGEPGCDISKPGNNSGAAREHFGWSVEPNVGRVAHGVPKRVDRLRSLGNAVVSQIPELIGRAILQRLPTTA